MGIRRRDSFALALGTDGDGEWMGLINIKLSVRKACGKWGFGIRNIGGDAYPNPSPNRSWSWSHSRNRSAGRRLISRGAAISAFN